MSSTVTQILTAFFVGSQFLRGIPVEVTHRYSSAVGVPPFKAFVTSIADIPIRIPLLTQEYDGIYNYFGPVIPIKVPERHLFSNFTFDPKEGTVSMELAAPYTFYGKLLFEAQV